MKPWPASNRGAMLLLVASVVGSNARAQLPPTLPPSPVVAGEFGELVGVGPVTEHRVSGRIVEELNCPVTLTDSVINLAVWYMLPDGADWVRPVRRSTFGSFGYDRLVVGGRYDLEQGKLAGSAKIQEAGRFTIAWKEVIPPNRTPYLSNVYHVTEDTFDPDDPLGFEQITVRKMFDLSMYMQIKIDDKGEVTYAVGFTPRAPVEFYGIESEKQLPEMVATCFPIQL